MLEFVEETGKIGVVEKGGVSKTYSGMVRPRDGREGGECMSYRVCWDMFLLR